MSSAPRSTRSRGSDALRMGAVLVLLAVVIGGMLYLKVSGDGAVGGPKSDAKVDITIEDAATRWDGYHKRFKDGKEKLDPNAPEFLYFVDRLQRAITPEYVSKGAREDQEVLLKKLGEATGREIKNPSAEAAAMMFDHPDACRGRMFKISGRLTNLFQEKIGVTTPSTTGMVYLGMLSETYTQRPIHFYIPTLPLRADGGKFATHAVKAGEWQRKEIDSEAFVEIEGVFVRLYRYEFLDESGKTPETIAAVLFVKNFREIPPPPKPPDVKGAVLYGIAGLAIVLGGLVIFAAVLRRKYPDQELRYKESDPGSQWQSIVE